MRFLLSHWSQAENERADLGHLAARWTDLAAATKAPRLGVNRIEIDAGMWSTPAHIESAEEEIFYVLGGSGWSWQQLGAEGEVRMHEVREGDCIVHLAGRERHTLKAGADGLDVVAFGNRHPTQSAYLPRAKVAWLGVSWVDSGAGAWPWQREVDAGVPDEVEPAERSENIRRENDVTPAWDGRVFAVGEAAGAKQSGLNLTRLAPGDEGAPPHCHSAEEEFFVVLGGSGTLAVEPAPVRAEFGAEPETHEVRRGHVASFPAGSARCHCFAAGDDGLVYLAYGTKQPNDVIYYPRRKVLFFRGAGIVIDAEHVAFREP